jgi:shikimate kinase
MGSGKSTIGGLLAEKLGYRLVDLDSMIRRRAGKTIADVFRDSGEKAFRETETQCLRELEGVPLTVIAAGGGAPIAEVNRSFFTRSARTFFLEVSLETALSRTGRDSSRPLLAMRPAELKRLFDARLPVYRSLGYSVDTEGKSPFQIVEEILLLLRTTTAPPGPE